MISKIYSSKTLDELDEIRVKLFGKKGLITAEFSKIKDLKADEKKEFAQKLNEKKEILNSAILEKKHELENLKLQERMKKEAIDVTLFDESLSIGALHPITITMDKIIEYFLSQNFSIENGPLIEDDFHNFEALNLPKYHPARDMQDTFYTSDNHLLRTHTSPVQIRTMQNEKPPIRMIAPGAVFRRDFDLTHTPMFHQIEGLVVEKGNKVSFANLKYILEDFLRYMFGDVKVRFRPSFFPFTEPSAEVDISCIFCKGHGCRVCSNTGWLEVLGSGVVDPNVFKFVGYEDVSGYAFGLGVERFAMLLHGVPDLRSLFEGDIRLLEQFR
ncbi:phenylalanine--tRNA ligase subunit alpha [Campylobacter ureolyticus]|uniref:Phenylalanine--tRNA ligase alpha subunit n=1 Tax=Campylobacter ureolyticus TaxID=827 RepID=A0A9Q4KLE9_9BACT|nr:phenylalanine--tRNA ligase subunit alpha [Campylobacter ureolyticus]MCZ6111134.1 phenylalanine--tRNA ligase subunit alpha [Campylobacter ureolyticus]MCZ6160112.1 phenylalanine--tRNA ligase subunit alpha [Campylobacter ureolyticus]MCZ6163971.1 phenylalanine--tRNA ligase subunit alpha [Campylobacter ureolyticus]MCZ6165940.1 phenylalanine--tRNA ligase subunit alpha [Campylobacter ureolyticus]MCZ6167370.1 phenylalanine--tRNA ligase subunit alpha [Campylobacter ureolyticus]